MSRFASTVPNFKDRDFVRTLQFTLPGAPLVYYGSELGMTGEGDPGCRAPMAWEKVSSNNPDLSSTKRLIELRKQLPALRLGNFTALRTNKLLAFTRTTDRFRESVIVVANPTSKPITESFTTRIGDILSWGELKNVMTGNKIRSITGRLDIQLKPKEVAILVPVTGDKNHDPYRRIDPPQ